MAMTQPPVAQRTLSGPDWCSKFPGSRSADSLASPFRERVRDFLAALQEARVQVAISATLRPPQRAFLMHWCWRIGRLGEDPRTAKTMDGVAIDWLHRDGAGLVDRAASRQAASAMVTKYQLDVLPSLTSRHIEGRAIDMTISWSGTPTVRDGAGGTVTLPPMTAAAARPALDDIGRSYGVKPLAGDAVHWSDDGH
jgi:hypothetical protein